jgi:hypothetical protein
MYHNDTKNWGLELCFTYSHFGGLNVYGYFETKTFGSLRIFRTYLIFVLKINVAVRLLFLIMIANNLTLFEPTHPSEILKKEMEYHGISQQKPATQMGVSLFRT